MTTRLIRLEDGTLVEVEAEPDSAEYISGGSVAIRVESSFAEIKPVLIKVCRPIIDMWQEINKDMEIDQAEVEIGFNFSIEGDVYVVKSKVDANLKVKLVLKPKP